MPSATGTIKDDPYTMSMQLCDDDGMVSHEQVDEDSVPLGLTYLARHVYLQGLTDRGREYLKAHPEIEEKPWHCTGHAHLAGHHIRCTSPAHQGTVQTPMVGTLIGPSFPSYDPNVHRCSECFAELYEADRGYGSTALACQNHGFDRQIVTVPKWVEDAVRWHPTMALRYVAFVVDNMSD